MMVDMSRPKHVETYFKWNIYLIVASRWCSHLTICILFSHLELHLLKFFFFRGFPPNFVNKFHSLIHVRGLSPVFLILLEFLVWIMFTEIWVCIFLIYDKWKHQLDATIKYIFQLELVSTCFGRDIAHHQEITLLYIPAYDNRPCNEEKST